MLRGGMLRGGMLGGAAGRTPLRAPGAGPLAARPFVP